MVRGFRAWRGGRLASSFALAGVSLLALAAPSSGAPLSPAAATGAFGLDLLREQPPGNAVLSPDSVAAALAMTGTGAAGRTAAQIARTLHLAKPAAFARMGNLQRSIAAGQGRTKAPTLEITNGLFLQQGFAVEPTFASGLQQHFGATPETVDFFGNPSGSLATVNGWVSDHTNGLIPQLFGSLPRDTQLVLANALYLKASWLHPFEPSATWSAPFHAPTERTHVQFMHETERLRYGSGRGYKAVDLPYRASTLSLMVVLPVGGSVGSLQRRLRVRGVAQMARRLSPRDVELSLPRFHLNTMASLNSALQALGMTAAFGGGAEFPGISTAEALKIDLVEHAADFTVDEDGTVAAAATGIVESFVSAPFHLVPPIRFNANRPFLFFLRDDRTGAVLFAGRLTEPASASLP